MTISDWVLAGFVILMIWYGWRQGTINVIAKVGALVLAYWAARRFAWIVADYLVRMLPVLSGKPGGNQKLDAFLSLFITTDGLASRIVELVVFVIIFVLVSWLVRRIAYALTGLFGRGLLGSINHALGAVVGFVLAVALILLLSDIVFPAFDRMGIGRQPLDFMHDSKLVLPWIRDLQRLI